MLQNPLRWRILSSFHPLRPPVQTLSDGNVFERLGMSRTSRVTIKWDFISNGSVKSSRGKQGCRTHVHTYANGTQQFSPRAPYLLQLRGGGGSGALVAQRDPCAQRSVSTQCLPLEASSFLNHFLCVIHFHCGSTRLLDIHRPPVGSVRG